MFVPETNGNAVRGQTGLKPSFSRFSLRIVSHPSEGEACIYICRQEGLLSLEFFFFFCLTPRVLSFRLRFALPLLIKYGRYEDDVLMLEMAQNFLPLFAQGTFLAGAVDDVHLSCWGD